MARTAVDASVLVAALLSWHEAHEAAARSLEEAVASRDGLLVPVPALVETYAVLTRLPAPHRLSPRDALELLRGSLRDTARLVGLPERRVWPFLAELVGRETPGGATYDAQILACARIGKAERLLTLNPRDFQRLGPEGIEVVEPA